MTRRAAPADAAPAPPAGAASVLTVEKITPGLQSLIVPIGWIEILPGNPRRGRVDQIAKSLDRFGQRKPLVVHLTGERDGHPVGYAEAGNHTLLAARDRLGWQYIAAVFIEEDETTAKAYSLADNRLAELGEIDPDLLADFVADVANRDTGLDLLADSGYTADDLNGIIRAAMDSPPPLPTNDDDTMTVPAPTAGDGSIGLGTPVIATSIVFDTADQQQTWYRFARHLRDVYPNAETTGERLAAYITDHLPESA